jgi:hypothetical protein
MIVAVCICCIYMFWSSVTSGSCQQLNLEYCYYYNYYYYYYKIWLEGNFLNSFHEQFSDKRLATWSVLVQFELVLLFIPVSGSFFTILLIRDICQNILRCPTGLFVGSSNESLKKNEVPPCTLVIW